MSSKAQKTSQFTAILAAERVLISRKMRPVAPLERVACKVYFTRDTVDRDDKQTHKGPRWVTLEVKGTQNIWRVHERDPRRAAV